MEHDPSRTHDALLSRLEERAGRPLDWAAAAVEISRLPYRRPRESTPAGVLDAGCGTCSTKHWLLVVLADAAWPGRRVSLWHRPYLVTAQMAANRWGGAVAAEVPEQGLVDVHTFATAQSRRGATLVVDITFPLEGWDGETSLPLHCGPALHADHAGGADPLSSKRELVARYCNPQQRERLIAALSLR